MNRNALYAETVRSSAVCVVDDDAATRANLRRLLGTLSVRVETFADAQTFLSEASQLAPICLIFEVDLPDMNGVELLERLSESGIEAPTILMAADGDIQTAVNAMQAGAVDFFEKPFVERYMLQRVRQILSRRLLN